MWTGENCNKVPPVKENLRSQTKPDMPDMSLETFCSLMTLDMMWPKMQPAWPAGTFCGWTVTDTSVLSCGCACSCPRVCLPAKVAGSGRAIVWSLFARKVRVEGLEGCKFDEHVSLVVFFVRRLEIGVQMCAICKHMFLLGRIMGMHPAADTGPLSRQEATTS